MKIRKSVVFILTLVLTAAIIWPLPAAAQETAGGPLLTLERIFRSLEFRAERFGPARWMRDGETYTTLEPSVETKGGFDLVRFRAETGAREVYVSAARLIPSGAAGPLVIEDYDWSPDGKILIIFTNGKRVWRQNTRGDYWIYELATGKLRRLGAGFEPSTLMFAKLSPDGRMAAYVVKNDIYVENLSASEVRRLTYDGGEEIINGTSDWVYEEEFSVRDGFRWSPDSRSIAFWQFNTRGIPVFSMIDNTGALYPKVISFKYPKAGQRNSSVRVGIVPVAGGYPVWLKAVGDPRNSYIARLDWAGNSGEVVFQHLNRLQNNLAVMIGDAASGEVRTIFTDQDEAWVEVMDDFVWLAGGKGLFWLSERDGWRHAYYVSRDGREIRLLTPGEYDVMSVDAIDEKGGRLYVTASPKDATKRFLYRVRMDGKGIPELVGPVGGTGVHSYNISPSVRWAFHSWSTLDTPQSTELVRLPKGEVVRPLAPNKDLRAKIDGLSRRRVEFMKLDIGGGGQMDAWRILPPDFDPAKKYPLFIYVYGEPAGQTVQDRWGGNNYLWHLMLAQQGYVVASFDNRGTPAPRGRAWRKSVYRQIGILASADQAAAARAAAAAWTFVDPNRIGIWGWSGGGSMTLNAMFRHPDLYRTGISVASVPDERFYDSIYQERYMGLPKDNEEGYRDGSPINFAKNLKGNLLIVHGTGDDNVHYQGFETLIDELVANNKQFAMLSYPNRTHGISEGRGTTLHLYTALTNFLKANLPPGGR